MLHKMQIMDQTILFIQKATFLFWGPSLKMFHTLYPQTACVSQNLITKRYKRS